MAKPSLLYRFYLGYNKAAEVLSVILLVATTIIVFIAVGARYIFRMPFEWSEEFARYGFIWICFLGFALAEKSGDHFRITYFSDKLPPKARLVVEIFLNGLILVVMCRFFAESVNYYNQGKSGISTIMLIPLNYIYAALPVGIILMAFNRIKIFAGIIIDCVRRIKDPGYTPAAPEVH
ncbi:MAG: TRAP transporter small permease [Spirochaetia bacterium]|jgi:TRAP-type C4-dicarboxylate transport system permease small subunit|nr:TRAP transporter small permease [Spirochaetia bacterium]